ncbi:hypothetical protein SL1157_0540 [Ruegeria lacuscaerulensis ITI-1157]|nr:hypothetical protein SL1157_0540 [Ruegeria lacuscaerulensis ITI-1157]
MRHGESARRRVASALRCRRRARLSTAEPRADLVSSVMRRF